MFSLTTKEAIKVGLSASLALILALWFGWDKTYWSAATVFIVAANETYSHAIKKGQNRLIGTLFGVVFGQLITSTFAQDRFLFLFVFSLLLAVCVFMSSHQDRGYVFTMIVTVSAITMSMGGLDSAQTFDISILRIQETLLGVLVYSFVHRVLWPQKTEDHFFVLIASATQKLKKRYAMAHLQGSANSENDTVQKSNAAQHEELLVLFNKLTDLLTLPLNSSPRLKNERESWALIIKGMKRLEHLITQWENGDNSKRALFLEGGKLVSESIASPKSCNVNLKAWITNIDLNGDYSEAKASAFNAPFNLRVRLTLKAFSIYWMCILLWIYVPVPGGFFMPLMAAILANVFATLPDSMIKNVAGGALGWGTLFLSQYVFIMPTLTEAWQLALLFFIDGVFVWKVCAKPEQALQKILGGNFAVFMSMGGLQLTPSYDITTSLTMLMTVYIVLGVLSFNNRLFQKA